MAQALHLHLRDCSSPLYPARKRVSAHQCGIVLRTCDGHGAAGDSTIPFSIQSKSQVFSLTLAMRCLGESLWDRIEREPSGNAFNSLVQLETERGIARNPFFNAGAIAVADRLLSHGDAVSDILDVAVELVLRGHHRDCRAIAAWAAASLPWCPTP